MEPITGFEGRAVALPADNVDTDQIIPARFLTTVSRDGLGEALFANWRYASDGTARPDFVLNQPAAHGAVFLVAGHNFGCGSSREHAPWALVQFGFRAVVSTSFADIFRQNALKNGLIPVVLPAPAHGDLLRVTAAGGVRLRLDLATQTLTLPDGRAVVFPIDAFAKSCLLKGVDEVGYILGHEEAIGRYERQRHEAGIGMPAGERAPVRI